MNQSLRDKIKERMSELVLRVREEPKLKRQMHLLLAVIGIIVILLLLSVCDVGGTFGLIARSLCFIGLLAILYLDTK